MQELKFLEDNQLFVEDVKKIINDNVNYPRNINDTYHGAGFLFVAGMIQGVQVFDNITHRNECLSLLPVLYDDLEDIYKKLDNVTSHTDLIDLLKFVVHKIEHIENKLEATEEDCKIMLLDIEKAIVSVDKFLKEKQKSGKIIFRHFFSNFGIFIQKIEESKGYFLQKEWYNAGYSFGDLMNFLFIWDYMSIH